MLPDWVTYLSVATLFCGFCCALVIAGDLAAGHKQHMWIMNVVWPVTALFGTAFSVYFYFKYGRLASRQEVMKATEEDREPRHKTQTPFPAIVGKGAAHCGSGCTLGDICAEFLALMFPVLATGVGWKWLFPETHHGKIFAIWILDYIFAFGFGVLFQYFTIVPMRDLSPEKGIIEAVKADALSLTAWQIGMYGMMAIFHFYVFTNIWDAEVTPDMPVFWFVMQIAMLFGFATSYPVNWWLIRKGIKERM